MGQAKLRGAFQQRQAEGIKKRQKEKIDRLRAIAEAESLLTPKQRREKIEARILLSSILGVCCW